MLGAAVLWGGVALAGIAAASASPVCAVTVATVVFGAMVMAAAAGEAFPSPSKRRPVPRLRPLPYQRMPAGGHGR